MVRADSLTPGDVLAILWRYRWPALVLAGLVGPLLYAYSLFLPEKFTASTLVLVQDTAPGATYVRSPASLDLEARLRTLREQVLSRTRLQAVMDQYDLFREADSWEKRLSRMRGRIDIEVSRTDAFRISFTSGDPVVARDVTNSLAQLFIDASAGALSQQAQSTAGLIEQEAGELRDQLATQEQEIADFKAANMGKLPEQLESNQGTLNRLREQLVANQSALSAARDRVVDLQRAVSESRSAGTAQRTAQDVAQEILAAGSVDLEARIASRPPVVQLAVLRMWRQQLLSRYTSRHPDVRRVDVKIAELERRVDPDATLAPAAAPLADGSVAEQDLAAARREVTTLESRQSSLRAEIAEYERRVAATPAVEQRLAELERDRTTLARSYDELLSRRMEASLAGDLERTRPTAGFEVIDPAVVPERKSSPTRSMYLVTGTLLGFALGLGGGVGRELLWQPLHDADELERHLGLPVLSEIPLVDAAGSKRRRLMIRFAAVAVVGLVNLGVFVLRLRMMAP